MPLDTPRRGTRPSPARLREALFDALQFRARGPFLDLYAGSGAVGLEAASRGFPATLVERDRRAAAVLRGNARRLRLAAEAEVVEDDALRVARARAGRYEVVFAAPPYPLDLVATFAAILAAGPARPGGVYLFQHPASLDLARALADGGATGVDPAAARTKRYGSNAVTRLPVPSHG
jgi:16S rRNA (guanine(966)-N(2))-methyltransferase RsmD